MPYKIIFERSAEKFLRKQDKSLQERILRAITQLPDTGDIKRLIGTDSLLRCRIGDVRVIFRVDEVSKTVIITAIGSRSQIYKDCH